MMWYNIKYRVTHLWPFFCIFYESGVVMDFWTNSGHTGNGLTADIGVAADKVKWGMFKLTFKHPSVIAVFTKFIDNKNISSRVCNYIKLVHLTELTQGCNPNSDLLFYYFEY